MEYKGFKRERVLTDYKDVNEFATLIPFFELKVIRIGIGSEYKSLNSYEAKNGPINYSNFIVYEQKLTTLSITTKYASEDLSVTTYKFSLNEQPIAAKSGFKMFSELAKAFRIPRATQYEWFDHNKWFDDETGKYLCSARPLVDFNEKLSGKEYKDCYEYDLNSAYSSTLMGKIPDLYNPKFINLNRVPKGFIGFLIDDELTMCSEGQIADVIFPLIDAPQKLIDYCNKYYNIKNTLKGQAKIEAKAQLNFPIGYTQRFNPFFRSFVVHSCNEKIKKILDQDSLFWNTDAIISRTKRDDLTCGSEIGNFKEIHYKTVRYIGNIYQTDNDIPVYRGIPKEWFINFEKKKNRPFNILKDDVPPQHNKYVFDWNTLKISLNKE